MSIHHHILCLLRISTRSINFEHKTYACGRWTRSLHFGRVSCQDNKEKSDLHKPSEEKSIDDYKSISTEKPSQNYLDKYECPDDESELPKKHVFQEIKEVQTSNAIFTMEEAAVHVPPQGLRLYFKYPRLADNHSDSEYALRSVDNEYTTITQFPEITDFVMAGGGLIGSATAYYLKRILTRLGDVLVLDKSPYSPTNCTALCNGLITSQSKSQDISRLGTLSKELIRNLKHDILVTDDDFASIKYRPCTHLILWPESEVDEAIKAVSMQNEDNCFTEAKTPKELEAKFPWLKACDTDIALGTHGNQDEALVDPIALRNLYRTLAQAHGVNFVRAEVIDFNTMFFLDSSYITEMGAGAVVCRIPKTGELRNLGFAKILLCLGHDTPFLEARSMMETYQRDQLDDLHFLQPKLRICMQFNSMQAPIIDFPVITDVDGSVLIRDDYSGNFKYYLNYADSEDLYDKDQDRFMDMESNDPYPNLIHQGGMMENYFNEVIKPKLVNRIPSMEDAQFSMAHSGFESHNSHDGSPIVSPHPFHYKVLISGGYGSRLMVYGPASAIAFADLMLAGEEELFDMTHFYWSRVIKGAKVDEFKSLIS